MPEPQHPTYYFASPKAQEWMRMAAAKQLQGSKMSMTTHRSGDAHVIRVDMALPPLDRELLEKAAADMACLVDEEIDICPKTT